MASAYLDNDVLHKTTAYGVIANLLQSRPWDAEDFSMLGAARYIVAKKLQKCPPSRGIDAALADFRIAIDNISTLEPTETEVQHAASLEHAALQLNVELDSGESILCAVLLSRGKGYIFTGDKRAITAIQTLLQSGAISQDIEQRVVCLEQLFIWLIQQQAGEVVRMAVCAEPAVDRALSNCFCCHSADSAIGEWRTGLCSYIRDLEKSAAQVLAATP